VTDAATPLVPQRPPGVRAHVLGTLLGATVRASLLVSPRPTALLIRRVFAEGGARTKAVLDRHAPDGTIVTVGIRYGDEPEAVLDLTRSATATGPRPLVVWIHGGGWIGGSKDELLGYAKQLAAAGYTVATPDYPRAPEHRYPAPPREVMRALGHLLGRADELGIDPDRVVLAGDSAGAQIAAQVAALVTTPGYADEVGIAPTIAPERLRGAVLACGPYDRDLALASGTKDGRRLVRAIMWAYSGARSPRRDPRLASWSVTEHLSPAFPPTLVTVGSADPLRAHSELLARRLTEQGVAVDTAFWPDDHVPPLGHEYQFDLDTEAGRVFLHRMLGFLGERLDAG
jgi:acetyl esterase/lipase